MLSRRIWVKEVIAAVARLYRISRKRARLLVAEGQARIHEHEARVLGLTPEELLERRRTESRNFLEDIVRHGSLAQAIDAQKELERRDGLDADHQQALAAEGQKSAIVHIIIPDNGRRREPKLIEGQSDLPR